MFLLLRLITHSFQKLINENGELNGAGETKPWTNWRLKLDSFNVL